MRLTQALLGIPLAALLTASAAAQTTLGTLPAAMTSAPAPRPGLNESVAAVVNGDVISTYDLKQRIRLLFATSGVQATEDNIAQLQREALRQLVDERIEMQEIRRIQEKQKDFNPLPSETELQSAINDMAQRAGMTGPQLMNALQQDGIQPQTLRDQISVQMAWNHYVGARFRDSVAVGEDQIKSALQRATASAEKPSYQVSEIFLDASRVGGMTTAMDGARQLIEQIQKGAPFAAVAQQFSALPTAANGGDAGWLESGNIRPPELQAALEQMRPGQVSQPIPVSDGVYIIALRDKRAGAGAPMVDLTQAAVSLPKDATPQQVADAQHTLETLRGQITGCDDLEAKAAKVAGVVAGDLGETEVKDLNPEFQQAISGLQVGQVSAPVRSEAGMHLVALCGRHASGVKLPTRAEIESRLENEQFALLERRFLRDLRNSATIESR